MSSVRTPTDNAILLTLPDVSLGENESEEIGERNESDDVEPVGVEAEERADFSTTIAKQFKGERDSVDDDEGEYFCYQHLTNKDRLSPELQDVYKLLMQLPTFSHSSWSGFNPSSQMRTAFPTANIKRRKSSLGKTRKNSYTTGKLNKQYSDFDYSNATDSLAHQDKEPESLDQTPRPRREAVKMHSINLYQSILPSSLFATRKTSQ